MLLNDVRWAWRGVIGRGWRAPLVVGLVALAIAANTALFAVADALVFHPVPFPDPHRVVQLEETLPQGQFLTRTQAARRLVLWRGQADLFSATGGYFRKGGVFLLRDGVTEQVPTADVTIGMFDVLGVRPRWGRAFVSGDESDAEFATIVGADLARRYFGDPVRALGQRLDATAGPHRVVGVMPHGFGFPDAGIQMWRALDPDGPLARNFAAISAMARLAAGVPEDRLPQLLRERAPAVGAALGLSDYDVTVAPAFPSGGGRGATLLIVLLGAAACLLLATCANVASLELAAAFGRTRTHAIRMALGASRASLARAAAIEGAVLIGTAFVCGVTLVWLTSDVLLGLLPDAFRFSSRRAIGLDGRVIGFTVLVAAGAWGLTASLPVLAASRPNLLALLRFEDRSATTRGSVRLRQVLTVAEVAVAVTLVIGGLLYTRSYVALLAVDKGFDSAGLARLTWTVPNGYFRSAADRTAAVARFVTGLSALPGVTAITESSPPPSTGDSPSRVSLEIDGRPPIDRPVLIGAKWVDASFFNVVRLPLRSGRVFTPDDLPTDVVVGETFAKRFWADGEAVGRVFRLRPTEPWHRVIGVVGDFRTARTTMPTVDDRSAFYYVLNRPAPPGQAAVAPAAAPRPPAVDTGGSYGILALTVRLDAARAADVLAAAKQLDPALQVTVKLVDDLYADQNADTRLASRIVGGFSTLAFLVAVAGVYSLMAYLAGARRREIGVRLALGATRADILRLIIGSSARAVVAGAVAGVAGAVLASRWIESAMFGVTATDPLTYVTVAVAVVAASLAAAWRPARQAARLDPAITLRAE